MCVCTRVCARVLFCVRVRVLVGVLSWAPMGLGVVSTETGAGMQPESGHTERIFVRLSS